MPSISLSFIESGRSDVKSQVTSILKGEVKSGKELVRENLGRATEKREDKHDRIRAQFVENEGKGVRVDVSA